jgi:purine-nucleoside phosphorylase
MAFLAIEMETAGLYGVAAELGVEALAVLTVSDELDRPGGMSATQRESGLDDMTRLVLDSLAVD